MVIPHCIIILKQVFPVLSPNPIRLPFFCPWSVPVCPGSYYCSMLRYCPWPLADLYWVIVLSFGIVLSYWGPAICWAIVHSHMMAYWVIVFWFYLIEALPSSIFRSCSLLFVLAAIIAACWAIFPNHIEIGPSRVRIYIELVLIISEPSISSYDIIKCSRSI